MVALLMLSVTPGSLVGSMAGYLKMFFNVFVDNLEGEGLFTLKGDRLELHFSKKITKACVEKNI